MKSQLAFFNIQEAKFINLYYQTCSITQTQCNFWTKYVDKTSTQILFNDGYETLTNMEW